MRLLILHDALSKNPTQDELDTLIQVKHIKKALKALGHEVLITKFSLNLIAMKKKILSLSVDIIFNLVETLEGSQLLHFSPALIESLNIPFTGGGSAGMMLSSHKVIAKELMTGVNLPTPRWIENTEEDYVSEFIGIPLIIKPISQEASVGINDDSLRVLLSVESLKEALSSKELFGEEFINGREFNVSVLSIKGKPVVLPPAEMLFIDYPKDKPTIVGYEAKWEESSFAYTHTKRSFPHTQQDLPLLEEIKTLTLKAFKLFGNKGYARVDFRVDTLGKPYILEVNLNPCLAPDSGFVAAIFEAGYSYNEMIDLIISG
ncbi:MAG: ATP-grasp domain-containing protein [Spirochaetia bacterium]|nr:ATP-grasp domain-containing protein [Spirochaetia bacterium]